MMWDAGDLEEDRGGTSSRYGELLAWSFVKCLDTNILGHLVFRML